MESLRNDAHGRGNTMCKCRNDVAKAVRSVMEMEEESPHESEESEKRMWRDLDDGMGFMDNAWEEKLFEKDKVIEMRKIEIDCFRAMGFLCEVPQERSTRSHDHHDTIG